MGSYQPANAWDFEDPGALHTVESRDQLLCDEPAIAQTRF